MQHRLQIITVAAASILWATMPAIAVPVPVSPGYDLFESIPGNGVTGTFIITPFGRIDLRGNPAPIGLGTTDTIVERKAPIVLLPDPPSFDTVPIEIVALSLVSVNPIVITGVPYDVQVLGGSILTPSNPSPLGSMTINRTSANGGTFDALLPVNATLTFTEVGNPLNTFPVPFSDNFLSFGVPWSILPPTLDPHTGAFPAGGFFGGVNPADQQRLIFIEQPQNIAGAHVVTPASAPPNGFVIPEPASVAMLLLGVAALGWRPAGRGKAGRVG